jgi:hypothetical protein
MLSNKEIKIAAQCRRKGLDPDEVLQIMQVPYELTENGFLFDFDSLSVEQLSNYIDNLLKRRWYLLETGNPTDGVYCMSTHSMRFGIISRVYKFHVRIYANSGKTYLELSKTFQGGYMSLDRKIYGKNYLNSELYKIVSEIVFFKPSISGYIICDKCGNYHELEEGESPNNFDLNCVCGGNLKYIPNLGNKYKELMERKFNKSKKVFLPPLALIFTSLVCVTLLNNGEIGDIIGIYCGLYILPVGLVFLLLRIRGVEFVLNTIFRRLLYSLFAFLFLIQSYSLALMWLQIGGIDITKIFVSASIIISAIYGLCMIFKIISPDNPRNILDPPLWEDISNK